jgi:serine/threonine-protein kinase
MPSPSLLQRLKERKLVQWALAYLAGAFVVFQAVEVMAEPWGISPALQRAVHIVLLFGLLITLVLAWYHGEKGRQRVSGPELLMVAALLVVAGVALTLLGPDEGGVPPVALEGDDRPAIAVFPCENWSPDPDDAYFASGVHDEILLRLSRISGLRSVGRETMEWYNERSIPTSQVAQELGVGYLGECSVLKDGERNQVRLTFQLIDGNTGTQLWADNYDEDLTARSVFDIHSDVAEKVAREVGAALTPEEKNRLQDAPTENTEAYEAFNLGRFYLRQGVVEEDFRRAIQFMETALEADPMYAPAHAGIGEAHADLVMGNNAAPGDAWPVAKEAAERALEIDERLTVAHLVLALERMFYQYDWEGAEKAFLRSLEINPDQAETRLYYSWLLATLQRFDEGLAQVREARRLEPNSPWVDLHSCWAFMMLDQLDESQALAERMLESDTPYPWANLCLAHTLLEKREYARALPPLHAAAIAMGEDIADEVAWLSMTYGLLGREEEARQYADRLEQLADEGRLVSVVNRAWVSIGRGDVDRAVELYEEGFDRRDSYLFFAATMEFLTRGIRDHPRFQALRRMMGLEQEQHQP